MKKNPFSIKRAILIFLLFVVCISTMAQKINLDTLTVDELNLYKDRAAALRNSGMILTLVGGTVCTTGFILLLHYVTDVVSWDWNDHKIDTYGILFTCGGVTTLVGIPLWIIGGIRKTKTEITLQKFNIEPKNSMAFGVGLRLKF